MFASLLVFSLIHRLVELLMDQTHRLGQAEGRKEVNRVLMTVPPLSREVVDGSVLGVESRRGRPGEKIGSLHLEDQVGDDGPQTDDEVVGVVEGATVVGGVLDGPGDVGEGVEGLDEAGPVDCGGGRIGH